MVATDSIWLAIAGSTYTPHVGISNLHMTIYLGTVSASDLWPLIWFLYSQAQSVLLFTCCIVTSKNEAIMDRFD